uniref:NigD-like C-terminal domain-containing protein n=1 Tax=Prevotella sp. GTC17260 TaxID=3236796 RepID=A0AB33JBC3_9BACT
MSKYWLALLIPLLIACEHNSYDTGDGRYSYLQADIVDAHTAVKGLIDYCHTDKGDSLQLSPHAIAPWATTPDSTYRALLYYGKVTDHITEATQIARVPVLSYVPTARIDTVFTDPVKLESAWMSANRRYINLQLGLKTGRQDGVDNKQVLSVMHDSTSTDDTGVSTIHLRLYHRQNAVPEYYTVRQYISIPLDNIKKTTQIRLTVNTYNGIVTRSFLIDR